MTGAGTRERVRRAILDTRLVVVARRLDTRNAVPVARELVRAGVPALEITFENPSCREIVLAIRDDLGDAVLLGAGTVTSPDRYALARELDVDFVVSPVFDPAVVQDCIESRRFVIPGALTPSEVHRAWSSGADMVKVFPVEGIAHNYVGALREPFGEPILMGTGGVRLERVGQFLDAGLDVFGVGGGILDSDAIREAEYAVVGEKARQYSAAIRTHLEHLRTSAHPATARIAAYMNGTRKKG